MPLEDLGFSGVLYNQPALQALELHGSPLRGDSEADFHALNLNFRDTHPTLLTMSIKVHSLKLSDLLSLLGNPNSFVQQVSSRVNFWCQNIVCTPYQNFFLIN